MRRIRRGDWFSIVATDLFCGALCAVIILDAVSPRGTPVTEGPRTVTMSFPKYEAHCSDVLVVSKIETAEGEQFISSQGATEEDAASCKRGFDLPEAEGLTVKAILLAKGARDIHVHFEREGGPVVTDCDTATRKCR